MKSQVTAIIITAIIIFLFLYTGTTKLLTQKEVADSLSRAPMIGSWHIALSWLLPATEIAIAISLLFRSTRKAGFTTATVLLSIFTLYLLGMEMFHKTLPCSCGGVISGFSWPQHILLNITSIALCIAGYKLDQHLYCNKQGLAENLQTE